MIQKHKFSYKVKDENGYIEKEVEVKTECVGLEDVIQAFEDYLKGCGFQLDGVTLDLVEQESYEQKD